MLLSKEWFTRKIRIAGRFIPPLVLCIMTSASLPSCSNGGANGGAGTDAGSPLTPLSEQYAIDGVVDLAAVGVVHQQTINIRDTFGTGSIVKTATVQWSVANDDLNLYLALEWNDDAENAFDPASGIMDDFDGVVVIFDNNGNGTLDENEDAHRLVMTKYGSFFGDLHVQGPDLVDDAVADGVAKMTYSMGKYHAEFLIPLTGDAAGEDGVLNAHTRFNVLIYDHIQIPLLSGNIGSLSNSPSTAEDTDTASWPLLPYTIPGVYDQPHIPSNLTGRVVFISDRENPLGELYTFDPASNVITRVTHTTGLYMDGASLSHDRTKIAFFGAPSSTDYANCEIYTVNVDGTSLRSLTTNSILDGHPAWSPDDSTIVYASFRDAGKASLIVSTATGSEIANLTPTGWNDNDPDWLPDGRIVFKTDRFGAPGSPQVRIAVMNADGTNVVQLTNTAGTSDHDPTATNSVAVFERFTKGTDYSTDPSMPFSAWNIVEAKIDGTGDRTLIADGWVNWLPVHDPTNQYLVYLKSKGYTDARLMTKDGRDLGRLIPNDTKIRYIDWK
jgi:WD40-like Beta Propeller Repeat